MTFTDDDLKRLKESERTIIERPEIDALLARLEASEAERKYLGHWKMCKGIEDTCVCGFSEKEEAWRKAAGK